jgi:hypothetical protein
MSCAARKDAADDGRLPELLLLLLPPRAQSGTPSRPGPADVSCKLRPVLLLLLLLMLMLLAGCLLSSTLGKGCCSVNELLLLVPLPFGCVLATLQAGSSRQSG